MLNRGIKRKNQDCFRDENNKKLTDPVDIANKFNEYFIGIGTMFTDTSNIDMLKCRSYMNGQYQQSMFLKPIEGHEIIDIVKALKIGKSPGHDNITVSVIKESIYFILAPLVHIFNLSLSTGKFPHSMKLARVTPIYKKGSPRAVL